MITMITGLGVIFLGITMLIFVVKLMSFICRIVTEGIRTKDKSIKKAKSVTGFNPSAEVFGRSAVRPTALSFAERKTLMAVISASIASWLGTDTSGLRILSIKRVSGGSSGNDAAYQESRRRTIAAISTAVAETMGTQPERIRIHSIKRLH